jgi:glycosyltransferase involved in cell wall biosynthesis
MSRKRAAKNVVVKYAFAEMENESAQKIKVALVAPSMKNVGGQSIQAKRLLDAFSGNETVELIFIPNNPETAFQKVKFLRTIFTSVKFWFSLFARIPQTDAVHIFSSGTTSYIISTLPPLFIAKLYGKKTILHYHTGEAETHLRNWRVTAKPTMRMFDRIVVPSQFLIDVFARFGLRATAIFNFVESESFKFRARNPLMPVFLSNRNFEAHYQVSDVLRAFQLIQKKIPEAKLIVAGYGNGEAQLKKIAAELNLESVEFVGRVEQSEMPKIYDRADVYINSSIVDNMPLSIIEAFSCGLPVVSTDAGGIPYIIENGKTGLLGETKDFKALAEQAIRLFEEEELAQNIIRQASEASENYSRKNALDGWIKLYQNLNSR